MKNFLLLLAFIGLLAVFPSCEKQKMPLGIYGFTFENTGWVYTTPPTLYYEVIESTRKYIILSNQDTLFKDGKNVTGTITYHGAIPGEGHMTWFSPFQITGVYDKSKGVYFINGTFVSKIISPRSNESNEIFYDTTDTSGTFEFKQFFIE